MRSFETSTLVQYLRDCAQSGKTATFEGMSQLIEKDVQHKSRSHLSTALRIVLKDYGFVFKNIMGIGYEPLNQEVRSQSIVRKRQTRIKSETNRWREELETVDVGKLQQSQIKEYITANLKLCVQEQVNSQETNWKLERIGSMKTSLTGLEFAKEAALALRDVS